MKKSDKLIWIGLAIMLAPTVSLYLAGIREVHLSGFALFMVGGIVLGGMIAAFGAGIERGTKTIEPETAKNV
jgi:hypothetical protein